MRRGMGKHLLAMALAVILVLAVCLSGAAAEDTGDVLQQELLEKLNQYTFKDEFTLDVDAGDAAALSAEVAEALASKMKGTLEITFRENGEEKHLTLHSRDVILFQDLDGRLFFTTALEQMETPAYAQAQDVQRLIIDGETLTLPADGVIDPKIPRFMQATISNKTGDYTVLGNAEAIRKGELTPDQMPLVRLWMDDDGEIWTLDHRRLAAYKMGGLTEIPFRWATETELAADYWKMDTQDHGESMVIRMKRDGIADPVVHRDGTVTGLWNDQLVAEYQASIFSNEEINRMIDENYKEVQEKGYAELRIPRSLHGIPESMLTPNSLEVAHKLLDAGYDVYVVGGCIRDFIMGKDSNDIDFVTNATLEQQREIFGDQLITHEAAGRTFGVVSYPDEKIDLCEPQNIPAEFSGLEKIPDFDPEKMNSDSFLFDSFQRDLTLNAIYYDVATGDLVDFHGGIHDIREKTLNTMTDAATALRFDPRIALRAIRFSARYGFAFSDSLEEEMMRNAAAYVKEIAPYDVYSNISKMMIAGYATQAFEVLDRYGLVESLYPSLKEMAGDPVYREYLDKALPYLDEYVNTTGKDASRPLAMMAILLPAVDRANLENGLESAINGVLEKQGEAFDIRKAVTDAAESTYLANYMSTVASRFHLSAIRRSPYYEDALVLLNLYGFLDDGISDQIDFWNGIAREEPTDEETYQEEAGPSEEEAAQLEEEKLMEDLADAA